MKFKNIRVFILPIIVIPMIVFLNFSIREFDQDEQLTPSSEVDHQYLELNEINCNQLQVGDDEFMPSSSAQDGDVIFRYRTYKYGRPTWVSSGQTNLRLNQGLDVSVFNRGFMFDDLWVTDFDNNYYSGFDPISNSRGKTVQAWFQTESNSPYQTLFSNTEAGGFSLKVHNGKLRGLYRIESDTKSYESLIIYSDKIVNDGKWHHTAFTAIKYKDEDKYGLCLYIDGEKDKCQTFNKGNGAKESSILPTVGAEPNRSGGTISYTHYFQGQIYAVVVHDYRVHGGHLKGRFVNDGSRYFNMPSYHDYLNADASNDVRVKNSLLDSSKKFINFELGEVPKLTYQKIQERFTLPFADDYYVPQGISIYGNDIFLSYYYNATDKSEECDKDELNPNNYPSIIVEFNRCTSKLKNVYALYNDNFNSEYTGHVGGLSVIKKNGITYAYTPGGAGKIYRYILQSNQTSDASNFTVISPSLPIPSSLMGTEGKIIKVKNPLTINYNSSTCGTAASISYDKQRNRFWLADFDEGARVKICNYSLNPNMSQISFSSSHTLPVKKVQGAAALSNGDMALSASHGNNRSIIYRWSISQDQIKSMAIGPAGNEDLTVSDDGVIYTVSESGAKYYQKRGNNSKCSSSWTHFFPYVFGIHEDEL